MIFLLSMEERHEETETLVKKQERKIPADVYELQILPHLPARNLQILKTVSKDWLQLISSSYFVSLHHSRSYRSRIRILIALSSAMAEYNNYDDDQDMKKQIPYPPYPLSSASFTPFLGSNIYIMGSVDGLVCMFDQRFNGKGGHGAVFNPSTGKCLQLWPRHDTKFHMFVLCCWFGKSVDGEYVSVMLVLLSPGVRYEFRVYKLTCSKAEYTHSTVDLHIPGTSDVSIFVNGAVHWPFRWKVNGQLHFTVLAYDIYENKHLEMLPPAQGCDFRLGVNVDGCLLAIVKITSVFEVWIMKESWTKRANVEGSIIAYTQVLSPLGFFPNGDLILDADKKKLVKYSFGHNEATVLMEYDCRTYDAIMCADTLVSPSNSDC